MWMTPFYLFFGVLIVYIFQAQINLKKLKGFLSVICNFIYQFHLFSYAYISITETDKRTDYPGKEIAIKNPICLEIKNTKNSINVVLGDEWNAGNLSYHLKSRPVHGKGLLLNDKLNLLSKY